MGFLCFFEERTKTCFFSKKRIEKTEELNVFHKTVFSQP